jgi:hypothetical protein|nr:MAG TPA: hypothetical protein [Caudoviricetes sp.]
MAINYSVWNYEAAGEDWRVADVLIGNGGPVLVWPDGRRQFFASLGAVLSFVRSGWSCAYLGAGEGGRRNANCAEGLSRFAVRADGGGFGGRA